MVPRTFPSTYSGSGQQQMVVHFLPSIAGLKKWSDYIPVKLSTGGKENSYDNNGFISVAVTTQVAGRVAFKDYVPVYVDNAATDAWKINSVGYIPYGYSGTGDATLVLDFLNASTLDSKITFTRASSGTYFDSTGTLQTAGNNTARFDYNPSTLASRGLLIEEQRTNSIRNNTMVGAGVGTYPTNWSQFLGTDLSSSVLGAGVESGIAYLDVRITGTVTAARIFAVYFDTTTGIAATNGQTYACSNYLRIAGGSAANVSTMQMGADMHDSGGGFLASLLGSSFTATTAGLSGQRFSSALTTSNASTAFLRPYVRLDTAASGAIDITLRIGLPQLEQGAFATSVISTSTAAATRSADVASVNTLSPWYSASEGTLLAQYSTFQTGAGNGLVAFSDSSINNRIQLGHSSGSRRFVVTTLAATQCNLVGGNLGSVSANVVAKIAAAYKLNDFTASVNAGTVDTDTIGSIPSVNIFYLGSGFSGGDTLNGHVQRITYYPRRLSNAALQSLTA